MGDPTPTGDATGTQDAEATFAEEVSPPPPDVSQWQDVALRARADLENFRRRVEREQEENRLLATRQLVEDIVPVLDNALLALSHAPAPALQQVVDSLVEVLSSHGLLVVSPLGEDFDPTHSQALEHVGEGNTVQEVLRPGFLLGPRLLRPALVRVG